MEQMAKKNSTTVTLFPYPLRPNLGQDGYPILLRANYFEISMPHGFLHRYDIRIQPDKCSRKINRQIIAFMVATYSKVFCEFKPVFDGRNNLFTRNSLPIGKDRLDLDVLLTGDFKGTVFKVSIKWVAQVSLFNLEKALDGRAHRIPYDATHALDVVLRHLPSMVYTPVGRHFFDTPDGYDHPLGGGRELWFGYHQNVHPSKSKLMLNIDVSASPFYKAQPVIDFLCQVLNIRGIQELTKPLTHSQCDRFENEIKNLKIEVTHRGTARLKYRVCNVTRRPVQMQTFPLLLEDGQLVDCTVAKYFLDKYKIELKHPYLQCLQVGHEQHIYLPLEVCNIVGRQICKTKLNNEQISKILKETARSAHNSEREINNIVRKADFNNDEYVQEFGLTVSSSMTEVTGRVIAPPRLQFGGRGSAVLTQPHGGIWDMRTRRLYSGVEIRVWAIACFVPQRIVRESDLVKFTQQLQKVSNDIGMPFIGQPCFCKYATGADQVEPMFRYLKKSFDGLQLIVVILSGKSPVYAEVKRVGDTVLGIATQCAQVRSISQPNSLTISNLCLKINAKLGGINWILEPSLRPSVFNEPVIFFGADVFHGTAKNPSTAAVVASMDLHPSRYAATVRIQKHRQEIIQDLSTMASELLLMFFKSTGGHKPKRIIFYRDDLPESQFPLVLKHEMTALRKACDTLEVGFKPDITIIVVQKKHHTRLFCADDEQASGILRNIPPGTVVDVGITHPTRFDFYLCSHQGTKGTSRPALYHVLWDDSKFDSDELQRLTYQLCHTYARCTKSISIPAPVYYAHLAAFRARYHLVEMERDGGSHQSESSKTRTPEELARVITVSLDSKKVMYFV